MAKLIIVEGPDNSGKSTIIQNLLIDNPDYKLLDFPKRVDNKAFKLCTRNEVTIFETMLNYLDDKYTYICDRGYISNIVYGILRDEEFVSDYVSDFNRLINNHNVNVIGLTRNKIYCDFEDDNIKLSADEFNHVIDLYDFVYDMFNIEYNQILDHDEFNVLRSVKPLNF